MKKQILFLILSIITTSYYGCKKDTKCIDGNGQSIQETRQINDFTNVNASGYFDITISDNENTSLDLFGDSNILDIIETSVNNELLTITTENDQCFNTSKPIEVYLSTPMYKSVTLNGSGKINANNITSPKVSFITNGSATLNCSFNTIDEFYFELNGTGDGTILGNSNKGQLQINGSGNVFGSQFVQDSATVIINGAGTVHIWAIKYLNVTIAGAGSVYYKGDPSEIITNITGSGQLIKE